MTHTAAPWRTSDDGWGAISIIADDSLIAGVYTDGQYGKDAEDNACLVAAAPDLLANLIRLTESAAVLAGELYDPGTEALSALHCARAAIAKATGA